MGELLHGLHLTLFNHLLILLLQFGHGCGSGTRSTLIGSHVDALDVAQFFQRLQADHHHNGRTVRIGNDTTWAVQGILGVALRHHQGHILIHTEGAGVVNHHSSVFRNVGSKFLARTSTGRCERDVHTLEVVVVLKQFHFNFLSPEGILSPGGTLAAEQHQLIHREVSLIEDTQELLSHGTTYANNCYFHCLLSPCFFNSDAKVRISERKAKRILSFSQQEYLRLVKPSKSTTFKRIYCKIDRKSCNFAVKR